MRFVLNTLMITKLERIRRRLNWPQHAMGAYLGLTQGQISRIEAGVNEERGPVRRLLDELEARLDAGVIVAPPSEDGSTAPAEDSGGEA